MTNRAKVRAVTRKCDWVGGRLSLNSRPSVLFANATYALDEHISFFDNSVAPIQAANAETRLRKVMLAPYGDWPNSRGLQRFQKPDAEEIVKEFSNVVNKLLNPASWLGLPWYEGHPDHPDFRGKPGHTRATAVGRIKSLEAGDDGLYANVKFNEDGERLISNESYHGHSVNWFLTRDKNAANAFRPFRLKSVGFTNEPNIPVPAVTLANAGTHEGAIKAWEERHLNQNGRYAGEDLSKFGFVHKPGDFIPVDSRYSAMLEHGRAVRAKEIHRKMNRANSSPISRFRAMAQMRQMANGAPMGNRNASGKRFMLVRSHADGSEQTHSYHDYAEEAQEEGVRLAKRTGENVHVAYVGSQRRAHGEIHSFLGDGNKWIHSGGNSQSRFSVMRGMREMANVWSPEARKAALEKRRLKSRYTAEDALSATLKAKTESDRSGAMMGQQAHHTETKHLHRIAAEIHESIGGKDHESLAAWHRHAEDSHLHMKVPSQKFPVKEHERIKKSAGWL